MKKKDNAIRGEADVPRPELEVEQEFSERSTSPLGVYLKLNGISLSAFARAAGVPFKTAKDWASGDVVPNLVGAYECERITKGAVPMEAWLAIPKAKAALAQIRKTQPDEMKKMPSEIRDGGLQGKKGRRAEAAERLLAEQESEDTED